MLDDDWRVFMLAVLVDFIVIVPFIIVPTIKFIIFNSVKFIAIPFSFRDQGTIISNNLLKQVAF